jgi:hypothetical protein
VESDVLGLAALDFVLRRIRARMMSIAFDIKVAGVDADDRAADPPGLGIPAHAIANLEVISHGHSTQYLALRIVGECSADFSQAIMRRKPRLKQGAVRY